MVRVKIPSDLIVKVYKAKTYYIVYFLSKFGLVKKKINSKDIVIRFGNFGIVMASVFPPGPSKFESTRFLKILNKLKLFGAILSQIVLNLYKIIKDRFVLEGIGFKV
jgi:hypothetical protein